MISDEVRAYLKTKGITNVFYSFLPDTPNSAVAVIDSSGVMGWPAEKASIQIMVRAVDYASGYAKAKSCYDQLHGKARFLTTPISWCQASSSIVPLGQDEKKRFLFSCNFMLSKRSI